MAEAKDEPEGVGLNVEAHEDKNKSHGMCNSLKSFLFGKKKYLTSSPSSNY